MAIKKIEAPQAEPKEIGKVQEARAFAKKILEVLGDKSFKDKEIQNFLKTETLNIIEISEFYPRYLADQALYSINKIIEIKCQIVKIINLSDDSYYPPTFKEIEVKRDINQSLLFSGYFFAKYKDTPILIYVNGYDRYFKITIGVENKEIGRNIIKAYQEFLKTHNFQKNEKLEYYPNGYIKFLKYPKLSWDSLIVSNEIKDEIDLNLIFPLMNKELFVEKKIPWRRGILLEGDPGTGKTLLGKVLCNILNCTLIWVSSKALNDPTDISWLFDAARYLSPTLIFMEDIDLFGRDREIERSPILGELLSQLDGVTDNDGIFLMATSNRPQFLDLALSKRPSRLDIKIKFDYPDIEARKRLIKLFAKNIEFAKDVNVDFLVSKLDNFTPAHIQELIVYSAMLALKSKSSIIRNEDLDKAYQRIRRQKETVKIIT